YMLVVGYFAEPTRFRVKPLSTAALPAALLVVSLVFAAVFKYLSPPQLYPPGIKDILKMEWSFLSALGGGVMGLMVDNFKDLGSTYVVHQQYATAVILLIL